jgi:DNA-binding transcriptional LysR family regulator
MLNIHHLELFYYVALNGGISRAARHMPYGIQQPAISGQIILLEQDLGRKLFERQPFKLTPAGEELFAFVQPFFGHLDALETRLRHETVPQLRVGASELVLRDHLPAVIGRLRHKLPKFRLALRSGFQAELEAWLLDRQIDLAFTPLENRPPARIRCRSLVRLPLALVVPKKLKLKSAAELWARGTIEEPLITLPASENMSRLFQKGLKRLGVDWPVAIEASSMDLVTRYVANGYGYGVNIDLPEVTSHPAVRTLPLEGFEPLEMVALWQGETSPLVQGVLDEAVRFVGERWPQWACGTAG